MLVSVYVYPLRHVNYVTIVMYVVVVKSLRDPPQRGALVTVILEKLHQIPSLPLDGGDHRPDGAR
jgi:hypothetical protein